MEDPWGPPELREVEEKRCRLGVDGFCLQDTLYKDRVKCSFLKGNWAAKADKLFLDINCKTLEYKTSLCLCQTTKGADICRQANEPSAD